MNKIAFKLFLLSFLWAALVPARAQTPAAGCIKEPGPGSAWSVAIERFDRKKKEDADPKKPEEKEPPVPVRLTVQAGRNGVTRGQILFSDGHTESYYIAQGVLILQSSNSSRILALPAESVDPMNLQVGGFPGVAWVAKNWEKDREKKDGGEIIHYVCEEMSGDPPQPAMKLEAWVRKEDLFPVKADIGGEVVYHYEKVQPFDEDIPLPESYQPALARLKKEQSVLDLIRKANTPR